MVDKYFDLRRKRTAVGLAGCLLGLLVGAPVTYLLYGVWFNVTTFSFCCAGAALALSLGERAKKILKAEDLNYLRFWKQVKPLGLSSSVPLAGGNGVINKSEPEQGDGRS